MDSIRIKRGVKAQLPSELPLGELAFCTDTRELYVGMGEGTKPRPVTNTEITEHLAEWKGKYQEVSNQFQDKYEGLEEEYATRLTEVSSQLEHNTNVINESGLERLKATGKFTTNLPSYIAYVNTTYQDDNGTRWYLCPRDVVTTGTGGCLKLFADPYHIGGDYRDCGWYFSADQNGEKGYYGNGAFYMNVKVNEGGKYNGKMPDYIFSGQDGRMIAGRIVYFANGKPIWVFGENKPTIHGNGREYIVEYQKNIGFKNGFGYELLANDGTTTVVTTSDTADNKVKNSMKVGEKTYINGIQVQEYTEKTSDFKNALVKSSRKNILTDVSSFDVSGVNRIVINQPNTNTITSITGGVDGQEIDILCVVVGKTTIQHSSSINLKGGVDYAMKYNSLLTLINIGGNWYEKSRSDNSN